MKVLVTHASRHGSTAGIADRIAATLRARGLEAESIPVTEVDDPSGYDAYVIGGAAYMFHWLKDATRFARKHRALLAERPLWLFSSGPVGTDLVDDEGRDILDVSRPKEFDELEEMLDPRGSAVFFGAWDPGAPPVGLAERFMKMMPVSRSALPVGDFRDWERIDLWAEEIAGSLKSQGATQGHT